MGLSRKTNKNQYRSKSYRQNKSMTGRGVSFNEQLLLGINAVSRTILESNDNVADFVDNFLDKMFIVLINEDRYKSYDQINNYLDNNLNEIKKILFETYDLTTEFYENTSDIDKISAVKCLFYLCLYNYIEHGLRHYRDGAVGGNPYGISAKGFRRFVSASASTACAYIGGAAAAGTAEAAMLGCISSVGAVPLIGTTVCTAVCGYPVLVLGAAAVGAYGGWSVSKYLFNGIYAAAVAAPGVVRQIGEGVIHVVPGLYQDPLQNGPVVNLPPDNRPNAPPHRPPPDNRPNPPLGPPPNVQHPPAMRPAGPPPVLIRPAVPPSSVSVSPRASIASQENIEALHQMGIPPIEARNLLERNQNNVQLALNEYFAN